MQRAGYGSSTLLPVKISVHFEGIAVPILNGLSDSRKDAHQSGIHPRALHVEGRVIYQETDCDPCWAVFAIEFRDKRINDTVFVANEVWSCVALFRSFVEDIVVRRSMRMAPAEGSLPDEDVVEPPVILIRGRNAHGFKCMGRVPRRLAFIGSKEVPAIDEEIVREHRGLGITQDFLAFNIADKNVVVDQGRTMVHLQKEHFGLRVADDIAGDAAALAGEVEPDSECAMLLVVDAPDEVVLDHRVHQQ